MRRLLFFFALLIATTSAKAEWIAFDENEKHVGYIDFSTINRLEDKAEAEFLFDLKVPATVGSKSFYSFKIKLEFDCAEAKSRTLSATFYAGFNGKGDIVLSALENIKWTPIVPSSVAEAESVIACGKAKLSS